MPVEDMNEIVSQLLADGNSYCMEAKIVNKKQQHPNSTATRDQPINSNREQQNKAKKSSEDDLKHLADIKNNINLANQKMQELNNMNYQNYINDIIYQNHIISSHNSSIQYAMQRGIQFWKSYDNSSIFYRVNEFNKPKKLNAEKDVYSLLNAHIKIYNSIEEVQFSNNNTLILIASYLSIVKDDVFDLHRSLEWVNFNNMKYKNTFQYSSFLQKRILLMQKRQLEQQPHYYQTSQYTSQLMNHPLSPVQEMQLLHPVESTKNKLIFSHLSSQELSQRLERRNSIIQDFIRYFSKDDFSFHYIMNWLANFFQTFNKSNMALILVGDNETTNIFLNNIIKPIFAYRSEYFCKINTDMFNKSNETIIKDKIFYHLDTDNLTEKNIKSPELSKLLKELIKPNNSDVIRAKENNETYIHGEIIVTSSSESPYPFLKNNYSRCSVFNIVHIDTILKKFNIDLLMLEEYLENDLHNFSNILAQYQTDTKYFTIAETDEKDVLSTMKKSVFRTKDLENKIQKFIDAIKNKNIYYFNILKQENNKSLYNELVENFKEDSIYQPKLSEYFNIVYGDIIFLDNMYFIEILKEKECLFNQTPDDKFKLNGQRRYKLYEYELANNYKGRCKDIM